MTELRRRHILAAIISSLIFLSSYFFENTRWLLGTGCFCIVLMLLIFAPLLTEN